MQSIPTPIKVAEQYAETKALNIGLRAPDTRLDMGILAPLCILAWKRSSRLERPKPPKDPASVALKISNMVHNIWHHRDAPSP